VPAYGAAWTPTAPHAVSFPDSASDGGFVLTCQTHDRPRTSVRITHTCSVPACALAVGRGPAAVLDCDRFHLIEADGSPAARRAAARACKPMYTPQSLASTGAQSRVVAAKNHRVENRRDSDRPSASVARESGPSHSKTPDDAHLCESIAQSTRSQPRSRTHILTSSSRARDTAATGVAKGVCRPGSARAHCGSEPRVSRIAWPPASSVRP